MDRDLGFIGFIGPLSVHCIKVFIQWTGICWLDHQAVDVARPITGLITRPSMRRDRHPAAAQGKEFRQGKKRPKVMQENINRNKARLNSYSGFNE